MVKYLKWIEISIFGVLKPCEYGVNSPALIPNYDCYQIVTSVAPLLEWRSKQMQSLFKAEIPKRLKRYLESINKRFESC